MGRALRLATVFGIPVELSWSWFLILLLVVWSLALQVFPVWQPGMPLWADWIAASATAIVLFACLLAHELSHSLVGRRFGVQVQRITLFLFGGVSESKGEMPSPKAEFWIAIAGPLASLALAVLAFALGHASRLAHAPEGLSAALEWLGVLNASLAIFNLLPGFPLDGGRVLRAAIWARTGNLRKATRWSSYGGEAFAVILAGIGIARLFNGDWFSGFWLIFLGLLLYQAAQGTYTDLVLKQALEGVAVADLMSRRVATLSPDESLRRAIDEHFMREPYGGYPVVQGDQLLGMLTRTQIRALTPEDWDQQSVAQAMVPLADLPAVGPQDPVEPVLERLVETGLGRVPVREGDRLVGWLSQSDVLRYLSFRGAREIDH